MRQRVLHQDDRDARVLDARLQRDGDDARARLPRDARQQRAAHEADVRHETAGEQHLSRQHAEYVEVRVDAERQHEDDEEDEDRLEPGDDDAGEPRTVALDGQADDDGDEEAEE